MAGSKTPPKSVKGRKLKATTMTPWGMLCAVYRMRCGEPVRHLAKEYGICAQTLHRWSDEWGHEAAYVQVCIGIPDLIEAQRQCLILERHAREAKTKLEEIRHHLGREYAPYRVYRGKHDSEREPKPLKDIAALVPECKRHNVGARPPWVQSPLVTRPWTSDEP